MAPLLCRRGSPWREPEHRRASLAVAPPHPAVLLPRHGRNSATTVSYRRHANAAA